MVAVAAAGGARELGQVHWCSDCEPADAVDADVVSQMEPARDPEPEPEPDDHQSLSMVAPSAFNSKAARPRVVLHFHLSEAALRAGHAVVRPEDGGPLTLDQLVEFLSRSGCPVRIQPVLDPTELAPVDGYEIPARLRAAVRVRQIADVFPFGSCLSPSMDLDHTERYVSMDYGGPPGQTRLGNLGPFARPGHRAVTHDRWQRHQPEPGYFVFRSPTGYVYIVSNQGTLALGAPPSVRPSGKPAHATTERPPSAVDQRSVVTAPVTWWRWSTTGIAGHRSNAPQGWLTPNDHTSPKPTWSSSGT